MEDGRDCENDKVSEGVAYRFTIGDDGHGLSVEIDPWSNYSNILCSQSSNFRLLANGKKDAFDEEYWNQGDCIHYSVEIILSKEVPFGEVRSVVSVSRCHK